MRSIAFVSTSANSTGHRESRGDRGRPRVAACPEALHKSELDEESDGNVGGAARIPDSRPLTAQEAAVTRAGSLQETERFTAVAAHVPAGPDGALAAGRRRLP